MNVVLFQALFSLNHFCLLVLICVACPIWSVLVCAGQPFPLIPTPQNNSYTPIHSQTTLSLSNQHFHFLNNTFTLYFGTSISCSCLPNLICVGQPFPPSPSPDTQAKTKTAHTLPFKVKQDFHFTVF